MKHSVTAPSIVAAIEIAWASDDNICASGGNSRLARFDRHGNWVKSRASRGREPGSSIGRTESRARLKTRSTSSTCTTGACRN